MKIKSFNFLGILLLLFIVSCGCCKETTSSQEECKDCLTKEGIMRYSGDPATDGCGWLIEIGNEKYSLNKFKQDDFSISEKVKIVYKKTTKTFDCAWSLKYIIIEPIKIEKL